MAEKKTVCIIGGGPAGLVSLKRVLSSPYLTGTIFEHKDNIGGVWYYKKGEKTYPISPKLFKANISNSPEQSTETRNPKDGGVTGVSECVTTMYDDLVCNIPYQMMEFVGLSYENPPSTFLTQEEIQDYLVKYTDRFNLWPHIQLNTSVISVRPETPISPENFGERGRWIVETHNHKDDILTSTIFDAVMVCVGKDDYPNQPSDLPGLDKFKGNVVHSKYFKNAEEFRDKSVVLIGFGPSSADISLHLSTAAKCVTVCHKFPKGLRLGLVPKNVRETKLVKMVTENGVITEEDEEIPCDAIMFCTGYQMKFPFFGEDSGIKVVGNKYVPHLYKLTIFTKRPSLGIMNLMFRTVMFVMAEAQATYFVGSLEEQENFRLPSYQDMEAAVREEEEKKIARGWPYSIWFQVGEFGVGAWNYFEKMLEKVPGAKEEICRNWPLMDKLVLKAIYKRIFGSAALYKKDTLRVLEENVWEYECSTDEELFPEAKSERIRLTLDRETGDVAVEIEKM